MNFGSIDLLSMTCTFLFYESTLVSRIIQDSIILVRSSFILDHSMGYLTYTWVRIILFIYINVYVVSVFYANRVHIPNNTLNLSINIWFGGTIFRLKVYGVYVE
jgi:hypothetical protein